MTRAEERIERALGLIDTWLSDEHIHDGPMRQIMWKNVREVRAALAPEDDDGPDWKPGRWWRIVNPADGSIWIETSDPDEAVAAARRTGWPLTREWVWERKLHEYRPHPIES